MTRTQCKSKIRTMHKFVREYINEETDRLIASGGIDLESYENDFIAPKIILSAVLYKMAEKMVPGDLKHIHARNNLFNF